MSDAVDRAFNTVADGYARHRPRCPSELAERVASACASHRVCWEPGCGSGQVTPLLAEHFETVLATDPAEGAIAQCPTIEGVRFEVGTCEACDLPAGSVDLVASGQAAHWFDMNAFAAEVRRVAASQCTVAVWCYELPRVDDAINDVIDHLYTAILGTYWDEGRRHIDRRYEDLDFPFDERPLDLPPYRATWTVGDMLGYLRTWSAGVHYAQAGKGDAVGQVESRLRAAWGESPREVRWPVAVRLGVLN